MSEVYEEEGHTTPIKTPGQLIVAVVLGFAVPIGFVLLVVNFVTGGLKVDRSSAVMSDKAVAERLKPVGELFVGEPPPPSAAQIAAADRAASSAAPPAGAAAASGSDAKPDGAKVYQTTCTMCHGTGLMNSPKLGDKAAWKPRLAQGVATLHEHAIKGIRTMPAKGGNTSLSDTEVSAAVDYMLSQSK